MTHSDGTRPNKADRWRFAKVVAKGAFAALFATSGVAHFRSTETFMKIMPDYLPFHRELVLISGAAEILLGLMLLIPKTSRLAAWGLIALLIAVFPANVDMYQHRDRFPISPTLLLLRLPMQVFLILWAFAYTGWRWPSRPGRDAL